MRGFVSAPTHCDHEIYIFSIDIGNETALEHIDGCAIIVSMKEFAIWPFTARQFMMTGWKQFLHVTMIPSREWDDDL
jgi:hypothetical protein